MREGNSEKKAFFIDEQRKLYPLPLVQNNSLNTLLSYTLFLFCYNLRPSIVRTKKWKKRKRKEERAEEKVEKQVKKEKKRKEFHSVAFPITIITSSTACLRFRLGNMCSGRCILGLKEKIVLTTVVGGGEGLAAAVTEGKGNHNRNEIFFFSFFIIVVVVRVVSHKHTVGMPK